MSWNITLGTTSGYVDTTTQTTPYVEGYSFTKLGGVGTVFKINEIAISVGADMVFEYPLLNSYSGAGVLPDPSEVTFTIAGLTVTAGDLILCRAVGFDSEFIYGTVASYIANDLVITVSKKYGTTSRTAWNLYLIPEILSSKETITITETSTPTTGWTTWTLGGTDVIPGVYVVNVNEPGTEADDIPIPLALTVNVTSSISFKAYGCQPFAHDESEQLSWWAGGYRMVKKFRVGFNIVCLPFITSGDFRGETGNLKYWKIQQTLSKTGLLYILNLEDEFTRFNEENLPTEFTVFQFPIKVDVFEFGSLAANFAGNNDKLSFSLVTDEWIDL